VAGAARRVDIVDVQKSFGDHEVLRDIGLSVEPGSSLALLGPSGCGKTTLLRLIAGLDSPDAGTIAVGEEVMADGTTLVPPEKRNVGMVFQDWALFPHLTVGRNVGYGLPRSERGGPRVAEALDMVGLGDLVDRMPGTLSGGQQQRVALARAIAPEPTVLLLDEPFSNLDARLRAGVRSDVHRLLTELEITSIFVTHDQQEAFVLGDNVAVMRAGRIEQVGTPRQIYEQPSSRWVASFVGDVNTMAGVADGATASTVVGNIALRREHHGPVDVLVRPEELLVEADGDATVTRCEYYGRDMLLTVSTNDVELQVRVPAREQWTAGDAVSVRYLGGGAIAFAASAEV